MLFIATPYVPDESQIREHLAADAYCEKQGYDCLDLNQYVDEMDIDFKTDFFNPKHTNIAGYKHCKNKQYRFCTGCRWR